MKHIYASLAIGALSVLSMTAQSKIDLQGRIMLENLKTESLFQSQAITSGAEFKPNYVGVQTTRIASLTPLVVLNEGFTAADLEAAGYEVVSDLKSVAIVNVTSDAVEKMAELDCVRQISFGRKLQAFMDTSRSISSVDNAHKGFDFGGATHSFNGTGVVAGVYDLGIDPNHITFYNPDGTSRVKGVRHYYAKDNSLYVDSYSDATKFTTDTVASTHGTHTAGIMAGGFKGNSTYMNVYEMDNDQFGGGEIEGENPYYGVATHSDIFIGAGLLNDAASLHGFEEMAKYAKENGQPCVINYSVGTITGPHDGTDAFSQAVSEIVKEYNPIICMASGNDAGTKSCVSKTFTAGDTHLKTCITPDESINKYGCLVDLDIWADDATPFTFKIKSYKPKYFMTPAKDLDVASLTAADQGFNVASISQAGITKNDVLADHYDEAQIIAYSEVDENNGRYHVMAQVYYYRMVNESTGNVNFPSFIYLDIETQAGKTVTITSANIGELTAQSPVAGSIEGDDSNTISDCACNPDVISVGAYNNKRFYATLSGMVGQTLSKDAYVQNGYAPYSSYGPAADGRQLPEVLGPGTTVIAPYNSYYVAKNYQYQTPEYMQASADFGGSTYYWGAMTGTSMACPFVAGTIALWLEADPTLTTNDVHELIAKTSVIDDAFTAEDEPKIGAGRIDAVKGLKEILSKSLAGLGSVSEDVERNLIVEQTADAINLFLAGEQSIKASMFSTTGQKVAEANAAAANVELSTSSLPAGVYILNVEGQSGATATRKVVVR